MTAIIAASIASMTMTQSLSVRATAGSGTIPSGSAGNGLSG
jgi:hypothetical protein